MLGEMCKGKWTPRALFYYNDWVEFSKNYSLIPCDISCSLLVETYWLPRYSFHPWVGKIPLEEGMAINPSILAWRISCTEEPGRLQSTGLQGVGNN